MAVIAIESASKAVYVGAAGDECAAPGDHAAVDTATAKATAEATAMAAPEPATATRLRVDRKQPDR
jgi:hypothetical protein